jgi:23S rRNA pseudouridine2605 synthase
MPIRLQKYLADCGVASRRKSEAYIGEGLVEVNGSVVTGMGAKIDAQNDEVRFNGKIVKPEETSVYIMLHKPEEYVSTVSDQFERPTVIDLLAGENARRLFPVGRLDYDTSGLLLLTNDGELTYKLTHPKHSIEKIYVAKLSGIPTEAEMAAFRGGIIIDGRRTSPADIEILKSSPGSCSVKITIREGMNRQVRKMCEEIGHNVAALKRIATGRLYLGDLPKGKYRHLTEKEVEYLKDL